MEGLTLLKLRDAVTKHGYSSVALILFGLALTALVLDYAWMIYMHYKMVNQDTVSLYVPLYSPNQPSSRRDLFLFL